MTSRDTADDGPRCRGIAAYTARAWERDMHEACSETFVVLTFLEDGTAEQWNCPSLVRLVDHCRTQLPVEGIRVVAGGADDTPLLECFIEMLRDGATVH